MRPNRLELRATPYHALPTTEVFVAKSGQEVVATVTLIRDGQLGLPMECIYAKEIDQRRRLGGHVAEVSCLAHDHTKVDRGLSVLVGIMSLMAQTARRRGVDELVIAVHPHHEAFYTRFMGFRALGEVKTYGGVNDKPAVALSLDLARGAIIHPQAYKRFFGKPFPDRELRYQPLPGELREELEVMVDICSGDAPLVAAARNFRPAEMCA